MFQRWAGPSFQCKLWGAFCWGAGIWKIGPNGNQTANKTIDNRRRGRNLSFEVAVKGFQAIFTSRLRKYREPVLGFSAQIVIIRIVTKWEVSIVTTIKKSASIAQLVEQLFCKQQVVGSSPSAGSFFTRCRVETTVPNPRKRVAIETNFEDF